MLFERYVPGFQKEPDASITKLQYLSDCTVSQLIALYASKQVSKTYLNIHEADTVEAAYYDHFGTRAF